MLSVAYSIMAGSAVGGEAASDEGRGGRAAKLGRTEDS